MGFSGDQSNPSLRSSDLWASRHRTQQGIGVFKTRHPKQIQNWEYEEATHAALAKCPWIMREEELSFVGRGNLTIRKTEEIGESSIKGSGGSVEQGESMDFRVDTEVNRSDYCRIEHM